MQGYPGGSYSGNQGGYPGQGAPIRMQQGNSSYPPQGGYPGGPPTSGGYSGANPNQGGGYPAQNLYPGGAGAPTPFGGGYSGSAPRPGGPPAGQFAGHSPGAGGYGQPSVQIDPATQQWFSAVDTDRSGQISADELRRALVNGNWSHFSEEACRMMIELYDKNGSGTIDVNEFQQLFSSINQWRGVFQGYDTDKSGTIEQGELTKAFQQMGYTFSPMFVQKLISKYDMRTKKLSLDNFIVINIQIKRLSDGFRNRDSMRNGQATMQYEDFLGLSMGVHQ